MSGARLPIDNGRLEIKNDRLRIYVGRDENMSRDHGIVSPDHEIVIRRDCTVSA